MRAKLVYDEEFDVSNKIKNQIKKSQKKEDKNQYRKKDKADRATIEQCLDPKTILKLEKLKTKGDLINYEGCLSTGKEANVYYARGFGNKHLAIKIYKTSILVFKDRERYISGEFRFRNGYCKSNPRKMVAIWAEKEVRNLKRIQLNGIKTPVPLLLKSNLIIMELIGDEVIESHEGYEKAYIETLSIMKVLYNNCKLVHSDFSEYNLLYFDKSLYVIDVAQAVEHDHPNALSFLKRDCVNINNYFKRCGIEVPTNRQLFNMIVSYYKNNNKINENNNNETNSGNMLYAEEVVIMLEKARAYNREKAKENINYFQIQNLAFDNFEFPRSYSCLDEEKIEGNKEIKEMLKSWKEVVASYLKMVKGIEDKEAELAKKQSEIYQIETSKTLKESVLELEKQKLNVLF